MIKPRPPNSIFALWLAVSLACLSFAPGVNAQRLDQAALDYVVGSFEYALLHELAHLIIAENEVPVLGPLESTADYIATLILVSKDVETAGSQKELNNFLLSAASAFALSWNLSEERDLVVPYWDSHNLGIQRYYSMLCLLYGSDPEANQDITSVYGLPQQRAAGCRNEYLIANRGLTWLLTSYGSDEPVEVDQIVEFSYGDVDSQQQLQVVNKIRDLNIFEQTVSAVVRDLGIVNPFTAALRSCGAAQAAWQESTRELVVCYELLDAFAAVYRQSR